MNLNATNRKLKFKDSKGNPILLNAKEAALARMLNQQQRPMLNAMGIDIDITTLTTAIKSVSEQVFFEVPPDDFVPVVVGEGRFAFQLLKFMSYSMGGDFEQGIINQGTASAQLSQTDAGVEGRILKIHSWAKGINFNLMEVGTAAAGGNWDIITEKEKSRKKNWDLGIQKIAFLGSRNLPECNGLLTLPNVSSNLTGITKSISSMTAAEYKVFVAGLYEAYRENSSYTAEPDTFVIPEADYNGLASPISADFPFQSKLEYLTKALNEITGHSVAVKKLAYANAAQSGLGVNRYVLYKKDPDTLAMNIPMDYTSTMAGSINGFNWENAAYGQFTGVYAYRPKEILYFDYAA